MSNSPSRKGNFITSATQTFHVGRFLWHVSTNVGETSKANTSAALSRDGPVLTSPGPHAAISTRRPRNNSSVSVRGRGFRRKTPHRSHFQITVPMTKYLSRYRAGFAKRTFSGSEELRRTMRGSDRSGDGCNPEFPIYGRHA